jgi:hypothetical protein
MAVVKIAPKLEGQENDLYKLEERMHFLLGEIAECDRIIRQAQEAEKRILVLRAELANMAKQYSDYLSTYREEGA